MKDVEYEYHVEKRFELWECKSCGSPCIIEIEYIDGDPKGHDGFEERFQNRGCPCKSIYHPDWNKVETGQ